MGCFEAEPIHMSQQASTIDPRARVVEPALLARPLEQFTTVLIRCPFVEMSAKRGVGSSSDIIDNEIEPPRGFFTKVHLSSPMHRTDDIRICSTTSTLVANLPARCCSLSPTTAKQLPTADRQVSGREAARRLPPNPRHRSVFNETRKPPLILYWSCDAECRLLGRCGPSSMPR